MLPESYVDVLIIGAGPAGLMCANALAMAGINVRIIDKRPTKISAGQADGIQPRSIEVLQSYGLAERLIREGNQMHGAAFYNTGPNGGIECTDRIFDSSAPTARYPFQVTLHQGSIEAIFLDSMKDHGVEVERSRQPSAIKISEDDEELSNTLSYPVKVTLEHLDAVDVEHTSETVYAKYVLGADGAHSWVRKTLGISMDGEKTDYAWGVIDLVPETKFPDIRHLTHIHSTSGTCLVIPRERDIVRFYIQLPDEDILDPSTGKADVSQITPEKLLSVSRKIFHPYELAEPKKIEWWTVYIIGQRVASSYSVNDRVFIAGDACHTHSSKAGQGMNASFNDSHNLAWKIAQVLKGWSSPSLLKTYEHERRKFAQQLIEYDKSVTARMSQKPGTQTDEEKASQPHFMRTFRSFASGVGIHYSPSTIVNLKHQACAHNLIIGKRVLPQVFVRAADWLPIELHDILPADVRFKVLFFVGKLVDTRIAELDALADQLSKPSSFLHKYSRDGNVSSVFDIITIAADKKGDISHLVVPAFFRPHWTKVLLDDADITEKRGGGAYERFGIDGQQITLVIVRPDGYVGMIAPSTALADLDTYFGSFMIPCGSD